MQPHSSLRPLRWASWVAVSSAPQAAEDKISIPHQRKLNEEHCAQHGGEIVVELLIPGESRHIPTWEDACRDIAAYALLRDLIQRRRIDVLVFYDRTRLGRMASLIMTIEALCLRAGIALYETTNPPAQISAAYQYERSLVGAIGAVGAQQEVEKLKERRRIGMINRVKRGEFAGRPNWGYYYLYHADGSRSVAVDEDAAQVVRRIFALYLAGSGTVAIADELNAGGHRTPNGRPWLKSTVRAILAAAPAYAGYAEANKKPHSQAPRTRGRGTWQPLITEAQWAQVQTEMQDRKANRHLPQTPYRFSSVCYCLQCGGLMTYQRSTNAQGSRYAYLACNAHPPRRTVPEQLVLEAVAAAIENVAAGQVALPPADNSALAAFESALADNAQRLDSIQAAFALADNAYVTGRMDDARYDAQVALLRSRQAALEADRARITDALKQETERTPRAERLIDIAQHGQSMLHSADIRSSNAWLRRNLRAWCDGRSVAYVEIIY